MPYAQELARLLAEVGDRRDSIENQVVNIGLTAWRLGGLNCMRKLQSMAADICGRQHPALKYKDYISDLVGWHRKLAIRLAGYGKG